MPEAVTALGSYSVKQLLIASAAFGVSANFLSPDGYIAELSELYACKFSPADLVIVIDLSNETREKPSTCRKDLTGFKVSSRISISSELDKDKAHLITAKRLATHDLHYFMLPYVRGIPYSEDEQPTTAELMHALRVRGACTIESRRRSLYELLKANRGLLMINPDFTTATAAALGINALDVGEDAEEPPPLGATACEQIQTKALALETAAKNPKSRFIWASILAAEPPDPDDEFLLLGRLAAVASFFEGNTYMEGELAKVQLDYQTHRSIATLTSAVLEAEATKDAAVDLRSKAKTDAEKRAAKALQREKAAAREAAAAKKKKRKLDSSSESDDSDVDSDKDSGDDDFIRKKPSKKAHRAQKDMDGIMVNIFGGYTAKMDNGDTEAQELHQFKSKIRMDDRQLVFEHISYEPSWMSRLKELRDLKLEYQV